MAGQPHDSDLPKTKKNRRSLGLAPVMAHLKALQTPQKEDKLKSHGAYVDDGWVFATELGTAYYPGMMSTWLRQAVKECGDVRPISFHGCRHTCATLTLKSGQPVDVVSRSLDTPACKSRWITHVMPGQDESAVVALVAMYS